MTERMTLPVLPLRDYVLFPGVTAPINAGKPGTLKAIEAALTTPERLVFAVSQREDAQQATPELLHTIGTVARIGQVQRGLAAKPGHPRARRPAAALALPGAASIPRVPVGAATAAPAASPPEPGSASATRRSSRRGRSAPRSFH